MIKIQYEVLVALALSIFVVLGSLIGYIVYLKYAKTRRKLLKKASDEAKKIKMQAIADAKVESAMIFFESENNLKLHKQEIELNNIEFNKRKEQLHRELEKVHNGELDNIRYNEENEKIREDLSVKLNGAIRNLERVANLTEKEARDELFKSIEQKSSEEISKLIRNKEERAKIESKEKASHMIIEAMEKLSVDLVSEKTVSHVTIESEEYKGRIIGKEGRNIKAFEQYGGVDIIIDDSPNRIGVSSFNPIRREIAVRALTNLLNDGRIQPAKIEEQLILEEKKVDVLMEEIGKETVEELGFYDMNFEVVKLIGKLKFRTSYGQNALKHSLEVAKISSSLASRLGYDPFIAGKAGLLHDIGKAVDFEREGSHVTLGVQVLQQAQEDAVIINAVASHHGDVAKESVYAEIVSIADTLSAARPGARNNNIEEFIVRMEELEKAIKSIRGISNAFALQAGRQVRVIVDPEIISDERMKEVTTQIKQVVNKTNTMPGETVITVIRETRNIIKA